MKPIQEKLIRMISASDQPITADYLATTLQVSVRSIKTYVHDINQLHPHTILSTKKGYHLGKTNLSDILSSLTHIPQCSDERIVYIINVLIKACQPVDLYTLCEEMYISLSTCKVELQKVKRKIASFDLQVCIVCDQVYIDGLEKNKRRLLSTILYEESKVNFVNMKALQDAFYDIDIPFIKQTIDEVSIEYHYFINDYSMMNLILHITIAIDRIRHHNYNSEDTNHIKNIPSQTYELAKQFVCKFEEHFQIQYTQGEIYEFALLFISRATTIDYKQLDVQNLEHYIEKKYVLFVKDIIKEIHTYYYIDFDDPDFFIRFTLHIRNLLIRSQLNHFSKNPLSEGIKTTCPMIYEIAIMVADMIQQRTSLHMNEDEIAYIAFHLGSALESQNTKKHKINAVLYCPSYYDINTRLVSMIEHKFNELLWITNICVDESELATLSYDLLITTIPLQSYFCKPSTQISLFLNEHDEHALRTKINTVLLQKKRNAFERQLRALISYELFITHPEVSDANDTISHMVDNLVQHNYVNPSFLQEILEREQLASTAYGTFAIPHALLMNAKKTGLSILISKSPIDWNGVAVHLVIMLCFNHHERYLFNEIFEPITLILSDATNIQALLNCIDYNDFIKMLVSLLT